MADSKSSIDLIDIDLDINLEGSKNQKEKKSKNKSKDRFYVANSGIHGRGVFARKKIKKGTLIGRVDSKPTDKEEGPYVLWTDEGQREVTCNLKYINHSTQPNAAYYDDLTVVALSTILAGEEITHHYGDDWELEEA